MKTSSTTRAAMLVAMSATVAFAQLVSIPADQVDSKKVFWGSTAGFEKAGEVDYDSVLKTTPECKQMKKDRIERGTGKYWILLNQATDRATRAITEVGQDTEYDLIAQRGYLASLTPAVAAAAKIVAKAKKSKDDKSGDNGTRTAKNDSKPLKKAKSEPSDK